MRVLVFLALATLLAGCASTANEPAKTASVASNGSASPGNAIAAANATMNATPIVALPIPIAYQGSSPQGVCTTSGTPADQCQFSSTGSESFHKIDYKGTATHIAIQITYPAQQAGFNMYAAVCIGKAGAPIANNDCHDYKTAPSPMRIDIPLKDLAPNAPLGISIGAISDTPAAAAVLVFGQSDFKVQGTLTALPT